jgi:hypothetical protein
MLMIFPRAEANLPALATPRPAPLTLGRVNFLAVSLPSRWARLVRRLARNHQSRGDQYGKHCRHPQQEPRQVPIRTAFADLKASMIAVRGEPAPIMWGAGGLGRGEPCFGVARNSGTKSQILRTASLTAGTCEAPRSARRE